MPIEANLKKNYHDLPVEFHSDYVKVKPYTMVGPSRSYALWEAVNYVCRGELSGCFVECGVWRGGQAMLAAFAFERHGRFPDFHLYDTFAGMSAPTDHDVRGSTGASAMKKWKASQTADHNEWSYAPLEDVKTNMASTGYPSDRIHYHVGMVEHTLPESIPDRIAILRLDTDWYESTKIEMELLFPRVSSGGILIIDDYGSWQGARTAVDEYLANNGINLYLFRDKGGRVAIVP
jgi:hypothetical protein